MYVRCQMFIILALIYPFYIVLANASGTCDCDVLQINDTSGVIGFQNFTKQKDNLQGKPFYVSNQKNRISWNSRKWSYDKYNAYLNKKFEPTKDYAANSFSFESNCFVKSFVFDGDSGGVLN